VVRDAPAVTVPVENHPVAMRSERFECSVGGAAGPLRLRQCERLSSRRAHSRKGRGATVVLGSRLALASAARAVAADSFRNPAQVQARLLCTVAPSGLEKFFAEFGDPVPTRTSPAPALSDVERQERLRRAIAKASEYGMEILPPPGT
jgi:hypothetical protein